MTLGQAVDKTCSGTMKVWGELICPNCSEVPAGTVLQLTVLQDLSSSSTAAIRAASHRGKPLQKLAADSTIPPLRTSYSSESSGKRRGALQLAATGCSQQIFRIQLKSAADAATGWRKGHLVPQAPWQMRQPAVAVAFVVAPSAATGSNHGCSRLRHLPQSTWASCR
jgi:hypothetical protein